MCIHLARQGIVRQRKKSSKSLHQPRKAMVVCDLMWHSSVWLCVCFCFLSLGYPVMSFFIKSKRQILYCNWRVNLFRIILSGPVISRLATVQVVPTRHCVSRGPRQRGHLRKVLAILETYATSLPVPRHMGFAIGRPTPSKRHQVYELLFKLPQFAHGSLTSLVHRLSSKETLRFSIQTSSPFLRITNPKTALQVHLPTAASASSVNPAIPSAVMVTVKLSRFSGGLLFSRSNCSSCGEAAVNNGFSIFTVTIWTRCNNLLLSCSVKWSEEFLTCLDTSSFHFVNAFVKIPTAPFFCCEQVPRSHLHKFRVAYTPQRSDFYFLSTLL